jgi:peroxiredoxin
MRKLLSAALALAILTGAARAEDKPAKTAPKVVLESPDGKKRSDLAKLVGEGPVLVRLTCACSGCDQELPYFQKLQAAYNAKGLRTIAVFREKPEAVESYAVKKGLEFMWLADPKGELWKTFDAKAMPTNILSAKGGKVVKIVPNCTPGRA